MNVGSVSSSPIADLTRIAVAVQTARGSERASSPAVQDIEQRDVDATATGRLDTYA